jgi:hypothetical protein
MKDKYNKTIPDIINEIQQSISNTNDQSITNYSKIFNTYDIDPVTDFIANIDTYYPQNNYKGELKIESIKVPLLDFITSYHEAIIDNVCKILDSYL